MSFFATLGGLGGDAASGASVGSVVPGVGTAVGGGVGAVVGAVGDLFGGGKEGQREAYINQLATKAAAGDAGALKELYDWANGVSATESDGSNRGNEPSQSRIYAQGKLLGLQKMGISLNPTTGTIQRPGIFSSGFNVLAPGTNPVTGLVEVGAVVFAIYGVVRLFSK